MISYFWQKRTFDVHLKPTCMSNHTASLDLFSWKQDYWRLGTWAFNWYLTGSGGGGDGDGGGDDDDDDDDNNNRPPP